MDLGRVAMNVGYIRFKPEEVKERNLWMSEAYMEE
jgi:hypothetical protein